MVTTLYTRAVVIDWGSPPSYINGHRSRMSIAGVECGSFQAQAYSLANGAYLERDRRERRLRAEPDGSEQCAHWISDGNKPDNNASAGFRRSLRNQAGAVRKGRKMRVAIVAAELGPYAKAGGLADVIGALPQALARQGVETSVIVPG